MRCDYFDFLRGLAIMMVIAIHTYTGGDFETITGWICSIFRQPLNCAVPLFFAISGYFLAQKHFDTQADIYSFWKRQISKVYIPVLIWSLPSLLLGIYKGNDWLAECMRYVICGYGVFYFILVIIQYYLLLPLVLKINRGGVIASALLSVISVCITSYLLYVLDMDIPLVVYAGHGDLWVVFFVMGIALRRFKVNCSLYSVVWLTVCLFLLQIVETYFLYSFHQDGFGIKLTSFMFSASVILLFFHPSLVAAYREDSYIVKWIRYVGNISFGLYLIHFLLIRFLSRFSLYENFPWIITYLFVFLISILLIMVLQKILSKQIQRYLGI